MRSVRYSALKRRSGLFSSTARKTPATVLTITVVTAKSTFQVKMGMSALVACRKMVLKLPAPTQPKSL